MSPQAPLPLLPDLEMNVKLAGPGLGYHLLIHSQEVESKFLLITCFSDLQNRLSISPPLSILSSPILPSLSVLPFIYPPLLPSSPSPSFLLSSPLVLPSLPLPFPHFFSPLFPWFLMNH